MRPQLAAPCGLVPAANDDDQRTPADARDVCKTTACHNLIDNPLCRCNPRLKCVFGCRTGHLGLGQSPRRTICLQRRPGSIVANLTDCIWSFAGRCMRTSMSRFHVARRISHLAAATHAQKARDTLWSRFPFHKVEARVAGGDRNVGSSPAALHSSARSTSQHACRGCRKL